VKRDIEAQFQDALNNHGLAVIAIYGTSKQGKSSLRRSVLPADSCTFVQLTGSDTREGLFKEILNQAGAVGRSRQNVGGKVVHRFRFSLNPLTFFGLLGESNLSVDRKKEDWKEREVEDVQVDYSSAASVARHYATVAESRPIVLDNFHYADRALQEQLSTDVLVFANQGIKTVVLGTWHEQNYLLRFNKDLERRVCPISIEPWNDNDLHRILTEGEKQLNIVFIEKIRNSIVQRCKGNVSLLQDVALAYLQTKLGIRETVTQQQHVGDMTKLTEAFDECANSLVNEAKLRFGEIAKIGSEWVNGRTRMYWLITAFLKIPEATHVNGVPIEQVIDAANRLLSQARTREQLTAQVAGTLLKEQLLRGQQNRFKTPIVAYDPDKNRLFIVDSWTLFTLRRRLSEIVVSLETGQMYFR
jgi:hypothetical protein